MPRPPERIEADWPAVPGVQAFFTTRALGDVKSARVRESLAGIVPSVPAWLKQVHGTAVAEADAIAPGVVPEADASFTLRREKVCAIMTADCLPVLLAACDGSAVGAAHAGWRGLCAGVIEQTVGYMRARMAAPDAPLQAWLGPAIGPRAYEVGDEVREAFVARDPAAAKAFVPTRPGHWLLDLYAIARQRLEACGVAGIHGGTHCTSTEASLFYSYRRDKAAERMAAFIWRV